MDLRVHPTLIAADHLLAQVDGSMNAVMVKSDAAGVTLFYGAGAGAEQTASAVIADLVDLSRASRTAHPHRVPALAFQHTAVVALPVVAITEVTTGYYVRLDVTHVAQTWLEVLDCFADAGVHVNQLKTFEHADNRALNAVLLLTEPTQERVMHGVLSKLEQLPTVMGSVKTIRMERLQ